MNFLKHLTDWLGVNTVELYGWKKRDLGGTLRYVWAQKWGGRDPLPPPPPWRVRGRASPLTPLFLRLCTAPETAIVQCGRPVSQPSIIDMFHSMSKSKALSDKGIQASLHVYIPPIPCTCWKYMWTDDYVLACRKRPAKNHAILGIVPYCSCILYLVYQGLFKYCLLVGLFQKLSWGVGHRHFFVLWGEGVLLTMCPRGGGSLWPSGPEGGGG